MFARKVDLVSRAAIEGSRNHIRRRAILEAVRLFFHRIAVDQAFPLELKVPNARTRRGVAESEEMMRRGTARFASADEMFTELEEASGE